MKKIVKILLVFVFIISLFLATKITLAQTGDEKLQALQKQIEEYQNQINRLKSQAVTLSNQIAQFDAQIKLTTLKIEETQSKIELLGGRIETLEVSLQALTKAFSSRASETYKMTRVGEPFLMILSAPNITEAVSRFHYLQKIQESDRDLLMRLTSAQTVYKDQKKEQEDLQAELEIQKANLNAQKKAKANLLTLTRNDEKKYQQLLSQALAEKAAIEKALASGVKVGPIKRGEVIGLVGNSGYPGCSTGKHLHLEIRKGGSWTDPSAYLSSKSVINDQDDGGNTVTLGSGGWPWPIQDQIRITQFYGSTPYSWRYTYSGGNHTGLDMVSNSTDVITAPADGTLYKSAQLCGSSTINIVYIDHGDDLISFYLHVQ